MRKLFSYSIWQRLLGFWTGVAIALMIYMFGLMEGHGFQLDAGMKTIIYGVFLYGVADAILRTFWGTPRHVSMDEKLLEINGWFGHKQIVLSDIHVIEWDKSEKLWFKKFHWLFRIKYGSQKSVVLNGAFKEGAKEFAEFVQRMGVKLIEK